MNKIFINLLLIILIFTGCQESISTNTEYEEDIETVKEYEEDDNSDDDDDNYSDESYSNDDDNYSDDDDDNYSDESYSNDDDNYSDESYSNEDDDDSSSNDDYDDNENESYELHNQGVACLSCHGVGASSDVEDDERFTSGGTVYTALDSVNGYATGYKIRLVLENTGTIINYEIEEGDGNSYTEYSGSINDYTAQVINSSGVVVNASIENSHGVDRLNCNTCHTASGTGEAPGRITSYDYYTSLQNVVETTPTTTVTDTTTTVTDTTTTPTVTTTNVSFASAVMPVLENKCKTCHVAGGANQQFIVSDTASTYSNISTSTYVNTTSVDTSLLLTKGIGTNHSGGAPLSNTSSVEYQTISNWISQGALNN